MNESPVREVGHLEVSRPNEVRRRFRRTAQDVGGSTVVDSDDDPLIAPSIPVSIPVSGMLPTWVDERESSEEVGHLEVSRPNEVRRRFRRTAQEAFEVGFDTINERGHTLRQQIRRSA